MMFVHTRFSAAAIFGALTVVLVPWCANLSAVEPARETPITLATALARALAANPDLAVAARGVEAADGQVMQARARPNPQLAFQLQDTRADSRTTSVLLNQTLELGGERSARMAEAGSARDVVDAQLAARQIEVQARVTANFFALLIAQQNLSLAQQTLTLAAEASSAASKRVRAGKAAPLEASKAAVAEANARAALARSQNARASARQALAATWGEPDAEVGEAVGDSAVLPPLPSRAELDRRVDAAPSLRAAEAEIARREALLDFERARSTPDVTLSVGVQRDEDLGLTQAVVGFAVPLPLFDRNRGNQFTAAARIAAARDDQLALRNRLRSETYAARERLAAARNEAQSMTDEVLPGARLVYDTALAGFRLGKFSFLDVLDAQRTLIDAQSRQVEAMAAAHQAVTDIQSLIGSADTTAAALEPTVEETR